MSKSAPPKSTLPLVGIPEGGDQGARLGTKDEAMEAEAREPLIARVGDGHYGGGGTDGYGSVMAAHGEATPAMPTSARRSPLTRVCPFILGNELCERLAYYGLSTNLVVYFHQVSGIFLLIPSHRIPSHRRVIVACPSKDAPLLTDNLLSSPPVVAQVLGMPTAEANTQVNIWMGTCYVTPILGAIVADSYLGRYKTIMLFSSFYLVGLLLLAATNLAVDRTNLSWSNVNFMLFAALYIIAVGTGGIKPNVSSFGADQFDETDAGQKRDKESFFNWFYLFINLGSLVASTAVVYVQQEVSWTIGFAIPALCMFLATWIFYFGRKRYVRIKPAESPILRVLKVVFSATSHRKRKGSGNARATAAPGAGGGVGIHKNMSYAWLESAVSSDADDSSRSLESNLLGSPGLPPSPGPGERRSPRVSGAKHYSHEQVEEVRLVVRLFPMFVATIFYWTVYSQMQTLFVTQGTQMNTKVDWGPKFQMDIPAATLSAFDTLSIIVLVPLYDKGLVPSLRRCGVKMTVLRRIGVGLILASVSMVVAGLVERRRLSLAAQGKFNDRGEVDMSVFWQTGQYVLVGASEVFTSIGQLELFYDQAPDSMRSCCSALALLTTALGGYIAGGLIPLINSITEGTKTGRWIPSDLNEGHLDYFFYTIAGLTFLSFLFYLVVAHRFKYKEVLHGPQAREGAAAYLLPPRKGAEASEAPGAVAIPQRRRKWDSDLERTPIRSLMPMQESPALPAPLR